MPVTQTINLHVGQRRQERGEEWPRRLTDEMASHVDCCILQHRVLPKRETAMYTAYRDEEHRFPFPRGQRLLPDVPVRLSVRQQAEQGHPCRLIRPLEL